MRSWLKLVKIGERAGVDGTRCEVEWTEVDR